MLYNSKLSKQVDSYQRIVEDIPINLKVSDGEITNLLEKGSKVFQNKWQEIIEAIKHSKTINGDETSWKIGPDKAWLWTFVSDKAVRYTISETRGKGVPANALGEITMAL